MSLDLQTIFLEMVEAPAALDPEYARVPRQRR